MDIDIFSKILQSIFYMVGMTVAVLTYIKAKNGLLNTVNTEYYKKVIERLSNLSEELYREFDSASDYVWHEDDSVKKIVDRIHEWSIPRKEALLASGFQGGPIPISQKDMHLMNQKNKYKSDPFLPEEIREKVLALLEKRLAAMSAAYFKVLEEYQVGLGQGKYWDTLETNHVWIHNEIGDYLRKEGAGIGQIEDAVHEIRLEIQRYFHKFNPVKQ